MYGNALVDRTELEKTLSVNKFFPPFFSILIPELGRPEYVIKCVEYFHRYADMPIEIILHDDGSTREKQQILFDRLRGKVSTIIFNTGYNLGLAASRNRCRSMASSKYLLSCDTDQYMTSSFLKAMKIALDLPYIGVVYPQEGTLKDGPGVYTAPDGTKVGLRRGFTSFEMFGVRADAWDDVGGWNERVQTTSSDGGFGGSMFTKGYFAAVVDGTSYNEMFTISEDGKTNKGSNFDKEYIESATFARGDNNVPPIFGMDLDEHSRLCELRREAIWHGVNDDVQASDRINEIYPSVYNHRFNSAQGNKLYTKGLDIDWEFAKVYGHDKWKDRIIKDFNLER